jgi:hypothetical protein
MEKGELLRLKKSFPESIASWKQSDKKIAEWESEAKVTLSKVGSGVASAVVNDKSSRYDGQDYEKVMLSTRLALDHIALGDLDGARVEIKKTHEREALIQELHSKEIQEEEDDAHEKGISTSVSELNGYPVATLNTPEVLGLKNGYQNAFSHYLAGFLYESIGEVGMAAPGYKKAIELSPNNNSIKEALSGLDIRTSQSKSQTDSDVLFVVENGFGPSLNSITVPIPVPAAGLVPISFPLLESDSTATIAVKSIILPDSKALPIETITNIDAMAKRSLYDRLPGIILRGAIRAAVKGAAQAVAYQQHQLAGLAVNLINVATESADERIWKSLPSNIAIARTRLPLGKNKLTVNTSLGSYSVEVDVKNNYTLIPMRLLANSLAVLQ